MPAGTFKAFKLASTPGVGRAAYYTIWYAPDLRLAVKQFYDGTSQPFMGPGKFTTELVDLTSK